MLWNTELASIGYVLRYSVASWTMHDQCSFWISENWRTVHWPKYRRRKKTFALQGFLKRNTYDFRISGINLLKGKSRKCSIVEQKETEKWHVTFGDIHLEEILLFFCAEKRLGVLYLKETDRAASIYQIGGVFDSRYFRTSRSIRSIFGDICSIIFRFRFCARLNFQKGSIFLLQRTEFFRTLSWQSRVIPRIVLHANILLCQLLVSHLEYDQGRGTKVPSFWRLILPKCYCCLSFQSFYLQTGVTYKLGHQYCRTFGLSNHY